MRDILKHAEECHISGRYEQALDLYNLALTQDLDESVRAHVVYLLGTLYQQAGKNGIARFMLEEAAKAINAAEIWNNLGIAYKGINRYDLAREAYSKALQIEYSPLTLVNVSGLHINTGEPEKAYDLASKAFSMEPLPQAGNHMALASLEMGKWEQGFNLYDHRLKLPEFAKRNYPWPMWDGKKVRKLVIAGEQGLGDEIMFMTCFQFVKDLADEIVVECAKRLVPLFERSFGVRCFGTEQEVMENFQADAYIHMGSLPRIVRLWERWDERVFPIIKPGHVFPPRTLGHSWRGGTNLTHDVFRNFPLDLWKPLAELGGVSVQYGPAEGMAAKLGLPHDNAAIADFDQLVSLANSCEVVVTVCNTMAHIRGALDKPCYVLTPHKKAWRYSTTTEKMRWYRSVTLIQQGPDEDWASVVNRAKERIVSDFPSLNSRPLVANG